MCVRLAGFRSRFLAAGLVALTSAATLQAVQQTEEASVRALVSRFHSAVTAGDAAGAMGVVGADAVFLDGDARRVREGSPAGRHRVREERSDEARRAARGGVWRCGVDHLHDRTEGNVPGAHDRFDRHRADRSESLARGMANPCRLVDFACAPRDEIDGTEATPSSAPRGELRGRQHPSRRAAGREEMIGGG